MAICPECGSGPHDSYARCMALPDQDCPGMFIIEPAPIKRGVGWYFWKFVHNALIHPLLAMPWEPRWAQRAHDWTAQRCIGGG